MSLSGFIGEPPADAAREAGSSEGSVEHTAAAKARDAPAFGRAQEPRAYAPKVAASPCDPCEVADWRLPATVLIARMDEGDRHGAVGASQAGKADLAPHLS
jgi:hypothetical protein